MNGDALTNLGITDFDPASELSSSKEAAEFLQACIEEAPEDAAFIAHALGVVARAKARMASIAGQSGLSRESLYKALSGRRDPAFSTILKVTAALGLRLQFVLVEKQSVAMGHDQTANSAAHPIDVSWPIPHQLTGPAPRYLTQSGMGESIELEPNTRTAGRWSSNSTRMVSFRTPADNPRQRWTVSPHPSSEVRALCVEAVSELH